MAMPPVSNSSPVALCKDHDSVENEEDVARPTKKSKVNNDLVGEEEYNTDSGSVPKVEDENAKAFGELTVEDEKVLAELKDLVAKGVASLTDQEIFNMWCIVWDKKYSQEEKDAKFVIFQPNIFARPTTKKDHDLNRPAFADRTKEELEVIHRRIGAKGFNAFIFKSDIERWPMLAEYLRECKGPGSLSS